MPAPATPWENAVTRAMRAVTRVFGEGAEQIIYSHAGGLSYALDGIYEATTEEVDLDTGAAVLSNQPRVSFALADLQAVPRQGDTVQIRGKVYRALEPEFDGQGTVMLRLHAL